jgi:hypothetical protein
MKFRIGKHDFYWFMLLFLIVVLPNSLIIYFYDWYTVLIWTIGILVLIFFFSVSMKYITFVDTKKKFNIDTIKNAFLMIPALIIICVPLILYILMIFKFEDSELKKYGKETVGFIYDFGSTKNSKYHKVFFMNTENKKYKSEILGNYESYKLGDTIRVIFSERIPEINRAD